VLATWRQKNEGDFVYPPSGFYFFPFYVLFGFAFSRQFFSNTYFLIWTATQKDMVVCQIGSQKKGVSGRFCQNWRGTGLS
jgi:hypothetical protein